MNIEIEDPVDFLLYMLCYSNYWLRYFDGSYKQRKVVQALLKSKLLKLVLV